MSPMAHGVFLEEEKRRGDVEIKSWLRWCWSRW